MKAQSASVTVQNLLSTKIQLFWSLVQQQTTLASTTWTWFVKLLVTRLLVVLCFLSDQAFGLENVKEVAFGCGGVLNDITVSSLTSFMPNSLPY